jgi:hypothetical protein
MAPSGDRLPVVLMSTVPVLAVSIGMGFIRFQARRKLGVRDFRRTLEQSGMPRSQAARLAQTYHEAGSLRKILQGARFPGF